jgi:hypothetical protein
MLTHARRFAAGARLAVPAAATLALCFATGGFYPGAVALAAVVTIAALVLRLTVAARPWEGWSAGLSVSAGALALFATWTLLSASWSDAPGRALIEFDRALLYLAVLVLFGLFARQAGDLGVVLRWTAFAIAGIAIAAVITRLAPGTFPIDRPTEHERLAFPLTYWNSLGVLAALGLVLLLYVTASVREPAFWRVLAAAAFPAVAVTLYFTFSRGGVLAAAGGLVVYLVLGHSRLFLPALLAIGPPTAVALTTAFDADLLATERFASQAAAAQREEVLVTLALCVAGAGVLRALLLFADAGLGRIRLTRGWRLAVRSVVAVALVVVVVGGVVATDAPARLEQERQELMTDKRDDLRGRLAVWDTNGNGRDDHWRTAVDEFKAAPLHGTGAGTFQRSWERMRGGEANVVDAHSLYLEVLSELGWPGLLLLTIALAIPLAVGVGRLRGRERHAYAAFLAAGLALLGHAGMDWDWEMPALFVWFFAASGLLLARRPSESAPSPGRMSRVVAGLACLVLAITPVLMYRALGPLSRSVEAFQAGDCRTAVDAALDSIEALPALAEPFEVLGYCDARAGRHDLAVRAMRSAQARDPDGWEYAYGLAVTQALAGEDPSAALAQLRRANSREHMAIELIESLSSRSPAKRRRAASRAPVPYDAAS